MFPPIHTFTTRFIYPFFFKKESVQSAIDALTQLKIGDKTVWQPVEKTKDFYRQEMLEGIGRFIFNNAESEKPSSPTQYLVVNPDVANQWFARKVEVTFGKNKESFDAQLDTQAGIEIFLLPQGVGVLSISLSAIKPDGAEFDSATLKRFNYRLSQHLDRKVPQLALPLNPHPNAPAAPAEDSPFIERLGKRGGKFTLIALREFLLTPLDQQFDFKEVQQQFSIYSAVRFAELDFSQESVKIALQPLLIGLTHVEEPHHAGSLEIAQKLLNAHHWSAVGTLGAVHFVSDQAEAIDFNEQRMPTVLNKYFLPYLLTFLQRLILQHILRQAQTTPSSQNLEKLHDDMLNFMLNGYLGEVSSREVINQYYWLTRNALRVEQSFEILKQALHDLDSKEDVKFQCASSQEQEDRLKQMTEMQRKVEWLEVFFASYYAGALVHYIGYGWFDKWFSSLSTLLWAAFVGGIVLFLLKPWEHDNKAHSKEHDDSKEHSKTERRWIIWGALIILAFVAWLAIGFYCFPLDKPH